MAITVGSTCVNRANLTTGHTLIAELNSAGSSGTINYLEAWAGGNVTGAEYGMFTDNGSNSFTCQSGHHCSGANLSITYGACRSFTGGTDFTSTSSANLAFQTANVSSYHFFNMFIINNASNEKLGISHGITQNTAGAGTAPERKEVVHKWANTSNQITKIDIDNGATGDFGTATILKVWGAD